MRVFDKTNSAATIDLASVLKAHAIDERAAEEAEEEEADDDDDEDAVSFKPASQQQGEDITMDFTRSFNSVIQQPTRQEERACRWWK